MTNVQKVVDKVYGFLPKRYHKNVLVCSSYTDMLKILVEAGFTKSLEKAQQYFDDSSDSSTDDTHQAYNDFFHYSSNAPIGETLALAYAPAKYPILLNNELLSKESERCVVMTLLHEIGHLNYKNEAYHTEEYADRFAIKWMKYFLKNGIIK